jgi:uncharacterized repeat protein (TIGR02543 family)
MTGPESGAGSVLDGKAAVRIAIEAAGIQARTVLPLTVGKEDVTAWKLWSGQSLGSETLVSDFSSTTTTVYLETGTWDFTLQGYKNDDLILRGNIPDKSITLDGPNVLAFTVAPVLDGTGTFKITINLPPGHGITRAEIFKDGDKDEEVILADDAVVFEFEKDYSAEDYYFSILLYKDTELYGAVSELVQVRGNLRSEKTYTLDREDLNLTYTITYHLDGGHLDEEVDNPPGYYRSTDVDFTLPIPVRTGYTFGGWYNNAGLTGNPVIEIPQGSLGDKDFYAQWTGKTYTVTFKSNDGTDTTWDTRTVTVPVTTITDFPEEASPSREGYRFEGWNTQADGLGSVFTSSTTVTGDMTIYAQWKPDVSDVSVEIALQPQPGEPPISGSKSIFVDDQVEFSAAGTGYEAWQWYWDGEEIEGAASDTYTLGANSKPAGIYELSVVVTTDEGESLSARCRVTINAR